MEGRLLDPMCGTGGIALEAAERGYQVLISDIDPKMVSGTLENLSHFGHERVEHATCSVSSIGDHFSDIDGVATDPPYGRSSSTKGKGVKELIKEVFRTLQGTLVDGGHVAMALPDEKLINVGTKYLDLVETHPYFIHGSLVRHFTVFRVKD